MIHTNLKHFWESPIYLPYLQEPLTDEKLAEFEQKIGYRLPKSFVDLLKEQNGGYIRYRLPKTPSMQLWGVGRAYPNLMLLSEEWDEEMYGKLSFPLEGLLAFDGDGHYYHCLDYRQNKDVPQVRYIDIESDNEELVAETFDEFLQMLEPYTKGMYVLPLPLNEVITLFSKRLAIRFEAPDSYDYGYDSYRGKIDGHWIFLTPNEVPMAFAREGERNFEKLKNYEGKTAVRFPEIEENYSILEIFDEKLLTEILQKLGDDFAISRLDAHIK